MLYDLIVFDDDCSIHLPEHFFWGGSDRTTYIGYGGPSYFEKHWRSNSFLLRRLYKIFCIFLVLVRKKNQYKSILVYDDIVVFLLFSLLTGKVINLRLSHLKDYERMGLYYRNFIYYCLSKRSRNSKIYVISKTAERYLRTNYGVICSVLTSMVNKESFPISKRCSGNLIYSGTVKGRNLTPSLIKIVRSARQYLQINKLIIMAPKLSDNQRSEFLETLSSDLEVEIIESASSKKIKEVYSGADFGIAFYDVWFNNVLKQNFPLKTLEYLASDIIPIGNDIPAHRELSKLGFEILKLDNGANFLPPSKNFSLKKAKISNRQLVNELDQYFTIYQKKCV